MQPARRIVPGLVDVPDAVDVVVVGLGITGAGVALDAVTRGLTVLAVDAHDLAFGTSRWSSKLVHGGLRYLAQGQLGIAHESAVERGIASLTGVSIGSGWTRWGAVTSIRIPRSTALSRAMASWPCAR